MHAKRTQTTLATACSVSGRGYWSGEANTLTFLPAPADAGVRFVRADLPAAPAVLAVSEHGNGLPLRTCLQAGAAKVEMIEHVMAALAGLQIDNVEVHCTSGEIPGFDGSSHAVTLALQQAGRRELAVERQRFVVEEPIQIGDAEQFIRIEPLEHPQDLPALQLEYQLDFGSKAAIPSATFRLGVTPDAFASELAAARTFISQHDAHNLQSQGLALHVTERDLLVFGEQGPVGNELRFADECARHKTLDLLGDLALVGCDLVGRVIARKTGHQVNGELARRLRVEFLRSCGPAQPNTRVA